MVLQKTLAHLCIPHHQHLLLNCHVSLLWFVTGPENNQSNRFVISTQSSIFTTLSLVAGYLACYFSLFDKFTFSSHHNLVQRHGHSAELKVLLVCVQAPQRAWQANKYLNYPITSCYFHTWLVLVRDSATCTLPERLHQKLKSQCIYSNRL